MIGGGPAGVAAACGLAMAGRRVTLAERSAGPHDKVCGEFMSIEAQADLRLLGIDPVALGAVPIGRFRLVRGWREAACKLPFPALSLRRRILDEALLARAEALGVTVRRGAAVGAVLDDAGRAVVREAEFRDPAATIVLASGKHAMRGAARRATASGLVGLKMYYRLADPGRLRGEVQIHLFDGGYAGIEPVDGDQANLCLLVDDVVLRRTDGWPGLLGWLTDRNPALGLLLDGAAQLLTRPLTIAGIPYGFIHRPRREDPANLYRVGDQMAVIPSFCGDGLSIALRTGLAAADAIAGGATPATHHTMMRRRLLPQMRTARLIDRLGATTPGRIALLELARAAPRMLRLGARATRLR